MHLKGFFVMSMAMALGLVTICTNASPLPDKPHIYVEGKAEVESVPDIMTFVLSIEQVAPELAQAKSEVDQRSHTLLQLCKELGIAESDLATTTLHIMPEMEYHDGRRVHAGTRVSRQVTITLRNLEQYPEIMAALVEAKVSETVNTTLGVSDEKVLRQRALSAALDDARKKAENLAQAQGKKLGEPFSISEFATRQDGRPWLQVRGGIEMAEFDSSAKARGEPFEPGTIETQAQVYVVYYLR